jgi:hypothetical protein
MSTLPYSHVSLEDSDATREQLQALREIMRQDSPAFDEPPTLDDVFGPSDADAAWWLEQSNSPTVKLLDFRHLGPHRSVALMENEHPVEADFRYLVIAYAAGEQVDYVGKDCLGDAEALFRYICRR